MYSVCALSIFLVAIVKTNSELIEIKPNQSTVIDVSNNLKEHLANMAKLDAASLEPPIQNINPDQSETTNLNENLDLKSEPSTYYGFNGYRTPIYVPYGYNTYPYNYNTWYRNGNYYNRPYYYSPNGAPYDGFYRRNDYYPGQYIYNNPYRRQYSSYYY